MLLGGASLLALTQAASAHLLALRGGGSAGGGGGGTTITNLVVTETSGSTQTNVPITFGLPLAAGTLGSAQHIQVYAADGVTPIATQEDNRASDLTPSVRFVAVTIILPSLAANATVSLPIKILSGSPSTGTDITASDLLATSYDHIVTAVDPTGTWTASPRTALSSGNSGWVNLTTPTSLGTWRTGGGYCTEYILYVPLTSGASAHPQLRAVYHVCAFKAQPGAVSVSNPIIAIRTDRILENGIVQASSPADNWYGLTDTSGTNSVSFPSSTPAVNLTLSSNSKNGTATCTAASSLFSYNSIGGLISDGTGYGTISGYGGTPTQATVNVYKPFASSSLSGGSYTIYGVNHPNGSTLYQRLWWSGGGQSAVSVNLGTSWDGTSQTGGPYAYINSTELVPNYGFTAASVSNSGSRVLSGSGSQYQGTNPSGYWSNSVSNGYCGDYTMDIEQTGEVDPIGIFPYWESKALIRWDQYASPVIFGNVQKARLMPFFYRDQNTGLTPRLDNGSTYVLDPKWVGTGAPLVQTPANYIACWSADGDGASTVPGNASHMGEPYYISYLLTGDFAWCEAQCFHALGMSWGTGNPGYSGFGINRLTWTSQMRGAAWGMRSAGHTALIIPDRSPACLGWPKSHGQGWLSAHYTATNSGTPNVAPYPGSIIAYINNTGAGKTYAITGPRYTVANTSPTEFAPWQLSYLIFCLGHLTECGMLDANGLAMFNWCAEGAISACNDNTEVNPQYLVPGYWILCDWPDGTTWNDWTDVYHAAAIGSFNVGGIGNDRTLNGVATISGSGSSTQIAMPTGNFAAGYSFYGGGAVRDVAQLSLVNTPAINSGGSGYVVNDTVTLTITGFPYGASTTRSAVATVTSIGAGGAVTALSVSDPGLYIYNYVTGEGSSATTTATATQASTSGAGSGLTLSALSMQYGQGFITAISGDTLKVDTTTNETHGGQVLQGYPFANISMAANTYHLPWSAPTDPVGSDRASYFNGSATEYIQLAQAALIYLSQFGVAGASTALSTELGWTGGVMPDGYPKWYIAQRAT